MYNKEINRNGQKAIMSISLFAESERTPNGKSYHIINVKGLNIPYLQQIKVNVKSNLEDAIAKQEENFYKNASASPKTSEVKLLEDLGFSI